MRTNYLLAFAAAVVLLCSGCSEAYLEADNGSGRPASGMEQAGWADSVAHYRSLAGQGDGQAYLHLAQCYHEGKGVEADFVMTWQMVQMAEQYGGIAHGKDFFKALPDDAPDRLLMEAMDDIGNLQREKALLVADRLTAQAHPYADLVKGAVAMEEDRLDEATALLRSAAGQGCLLAAMAVSVLSEGKDALFDYAEQLPLLYCELARQCFKSDISPAEDEQAAAYYLQADERLCLDRTGVRWLLGYYEHQVANGQMAASDPRLEHLRLLNSRLAPRTRK